MGKEPHFIPLILMSLDRVREGQNEESELSNIQRNNN